MSRFDPSGDGDSLAARLSLDPGEVHAMSLVTGPDGVKAVEVRRRFDEKPFVKPRVRHLKDAESFSEFTRVYGDPVKSLVLFDSLKSDSGGKAVVVLDEGIERGTREFGVFRPEFAPQWKRWEDFLDSPKAQRDLLDLIEDYAPDILGSVREITPDGTISVAPGGAAGLRVALANLAIGASIEVKSTQVNEHDVLISFQREEKPGSTRIPTQIALKIPVFVGEEPRTVVLRLRTNDPTRDNGRLAFTFSCPLWDDIERVAWDAVLSKVKAALGTEFHVLRGDFGDEPGHV
jgi:hypothetical protein